MLSGISIWQLLIILVIVVLLFGTSRLRSLGGDLGSALKSFRSAVREGDKDETSSDDDAASDAIESTAATESDSGSDTGKRKKSGAGRKKSS